MGTLDHRPGVKETSLVVRHLKLEGVDVDNQQAILDCLDHEFGIDDVSYDKELCTLHLSYDATHCSLEGVEELIRRHGADISDDWWTHLKDEYYKFVDQNVKDNAAHVATNYRKPPPAISGRK